MAIGRYVMGAGLGLLLGIGTAVAAPEQPAPGFYVVQGFTSAASGRCAAGNAVGAASEGIFYYPGPDGTGAVFRSVAVGGGQPLGLGIGVVTFPATPAAGAESWESGSFSQRSIGPAGAQAATTGTFSARFAYADAGSFFLTLSYAANGCSVTQRWVLLRTG